MAQQSLIRTNALRGESLDPANTLALLDRLEAAESQNDFYKFRLEERESEITELKTYTDELEKQLAERDAQLRRR